MFESKSMKVSVGEEQKCIDTMQCFGWSCISTQEINSKESHMERRGDDVYSVTTSENYVKLMFQRDTNHPYYNELVSCEKKYYSILNSKPCGPSFNGGAAFMGFLFFIIPCIIYIISYSSKKKKFNEEYEQWKKSWQTEAIPALNKAKSLA